MGRDGHRIALRFLGAALAAWLLAMVLTVQVAEPPAGGGKVVALFPPGRSTEDVFRTIARSGARPIGQYGFRLFWVVDVDPGGAARLKAAGALGVFREPPLAAALAGCAGPSLWATARTGRTGQAGKGT